MHAKLLAPMLVRPVSAAWTWAAAALSAIAAVVWPPKANANVPPIGLPASDNVCTSAVSAPVVVWATVGAGLVPPVRLLFPTVIAAGRQIPSSLRT